jgi:hypothetical protein
MIALAKAGFARRSQSAGGAEPFEGSALIDYNQRLMVKHIVMLRLKDSAHGNDKLTNARLIKQKLEALRGQIPGMRLLEVGLDWSATDSSADLVIYSEFESRGALDGYQGHPAHQAVPPFIAEARLERRLVDYDV